MIQCSGIIPFQHSVLEISTLPSPGVLISPKPLSRVLPDMKHPDRKVLFSLYQISQKISEKKEAGCFKNETPLLQAFYFLKCTRC